jgi:regulator of sigma E protease
MLQVLSETYVAILVVVFLGLSIFVHEFGHFIAARLCGMVVETFSIGLGPALWKKKHKGIVYKIGWIPFGGYVALPQIDPTGMQTIQGGEGVVKPPPPAAAWKKIVVSIAGGAGNVILAIIAAWIVFWIGMPAVGAHQDAVIGSVDTDSAAYVAGIRTGDQVLSIDGEKAEKWADVSQACVTHTQVTFKVKSIDGTVKEIVVPTEEIRPEIYQVSGIGGPSLCLVDEVTEGMSAQQAGIRPGDIVVKFDGMTIFSIAQMVRLVRERPGRTVPIVVVRDKERLEMSVTSEFDSEFKVYRIGVTFDSNVHPRPSEQLKYHATLIFRVLRDLVTPKTARDTAKKLGGPGAIMANYRYLIKTSIALAIWFTGLLNINLAILNLLPIPVLDGGHIIFAALEGITGRPASPRVINILVNVFVVLLITAFVLLTYRDIIRFTPARSFFKGLFTRKAHATNSAPAVIEQELGATNDVVNSEATP